jgi:3-hydroxyisobutyrate dehydrogenase-like beta-hydroxyacid dehydrogenase
MKVGFIGLGQMGAAMAGNLVKAGHEIVVHNRTQSKAKPLTDLGAVFAASIADACKGDAVVTMLADDLALETVVLGHRGIIECLRPGALHVSTSTMSIAMSRKLTEAHAAAGQKFVAAPVFGRPEVAQAGKLAVVAAGEAASVEIAAPIFAAIGQKTFVISDMPWRANLLKLSGNFLIASAIESLGEAIALVAKGGIEKAQYVEILTSTLFNVPVYKTYGSLIAGGKFEPAGFVAPLGQKDIRLALSAAEELQVPMPIAGLLRDRFLSLLATGGEALDWSAIGALASRDAGITP